MSNGHNPQGPGNPSQPDFYQLANYAAQRQDPGRRMIKYDPSKYSFLDYLPGIGELRYGEQVGGAGTRAAFEAAGGAVPGGRQITQTAYLLKDMLEGVMGFFGAGSDVEPAEQEMIPGPGGLVPGADAPLFDPTDPRAEIPGDYEMHPAARRIRAMRYFARALRGFWDPSVEGGPSVNAMVQSGYIAPPSSDLEGAMGLLAEFTPDILMSMGAFTGIRAGAEAMLRRRGIQGAGRFAERYLASRGGMQAAAEGGRIAAEQLGASRLAALGAEAGTGMLAGGYMTAAQFAADPSTGMIGDPYALALGTALGTGLGAASAFLPGIGGYRMTTKRMIQLADQETASFLAGQVSPSAARKGLNINGHIVDGVTADGRTVWRKNGRFSKGPTPEEVREYGARVGEAFVASREDAIRNLGEQAVKSAEAAQAGSAQYSRVQALEARYAGTAHSRLNRLGQEAALAEAEILETIALEHPDSAVRDIAAARARAMRRALGTPPEPFPGALPYEDEAAVQALFSSGFDKKQLLREAQSMEAANPAMAARIKEILDQGGIPAYAAEEKGLNALINKTSASYNRGVGKGTMVLGDDGTVYKIMERRWGRAAIKPIDGGPQVKPTVHSMADLTFIPKEGRLVELADGTVAEVLEVLTEQRSVMLTLADGSTRQVPLEEINLIGDNPLIRKQLKRKYEAAAAGVTEKMKPVGGEDIPPLKTVKDDVAPSDMTQADVERAAGKLARRARAAKTPEEQAAVVADVQTLKAAQKNATKRGGKRMVHKKSGEVLEVTHEGETAVKGKSKRTGRPVTVKKADVAEPPRSAAKNTQKSVTADNPPKKGERVLFRRPNGEPIAGVATGKVEVIDKIKRVQIALDDGNVIAPPMGMVVRAGDDSTAKAVEAAQRVYRMKVKPKAARKPRRVNAREWLAAKGVDINDEDAVRIAVQKARKAGEIQGVEVAGQDTVAAGEHVWLGKDPKGIQGREPIRSVLAYEEPAAKAGPIEMLEGEGTDLVDEIASAPVLAELEHLNTPFATMEAGYIPESGNKMLYFELPDQATAKRFDDLMESGHSLDWNQMRELGKLTAENPDFPLSVLPNRRNGGVLYAIEVPDSHLPVKDNYSPEAKRALNVLGKRKGWLKDAMRMKKEGVNPWVSGVAVPEEMGVARVMRVPDAMSMAVGDEAALRAMTPEALSDHLRRAVILDVDVPVEASESLVERAAAKLRARKAAGELKHVEAVDAMQEASIFQADYLAKHLGVSEQTAKKMAARMEEIIDSFTPEQIKNELMRIAQMGDTYMPESVRINTQRSLRDLDNGAQLQLNDGRIVQITGRTKRGYKVKGVAGPQRGQVAIRELGPNEWEAYNVGGEGVGTFKRKSDAAKAARAHAKAQGLDYVAVEGQSYPVYYSDVAGVLENTRTPGMGDSVVYQRTSKTKRPNTGKVVAVKRDEFGAAVELEVQREGSSVIDTITPDLVENFEYVGFDMPAEVAARAKAEAAVETNLRQFPGDDMQAWSDIIDELPAYFGGTELERAAIPAEELVMSHPDRPGVRMLIRKKTVQEPLYHETTGYKLRDSQGRIISKPKDVIEVEVINEDGDSWVQELRGEVERFKAKEVKKPLSEKAELGPTMTPKEELVDFLRNTPFVDAKLQVYSDRGLVHAEVAGLTASLRERGRGLPGVQLRFDVPDGDVAGALAQLPKPLKQSMMVPDGAPAALKMLEEAGFTMADGGVPSQWAVRTPSRRLRRLMQALPDPTQLSYKQLKGANTALADAASDFLFERRYLPQSVKDYLSDFASTYVKRGVKGQPLNLTLRDALGAYTPRDLAPAGGVWYAPDGEIVGTGAGRGAVKYQMLTASGAGGEVDVSKTFPYRVLMERPYQWSQETIDHVTDIFRLRRQIDNVSTAELAEPLINPAASAHSAAGGEKWGTIKGSGAAQTLEGAPLERHTNAGEVVKIVGVGDSPDTYKVRTWRGEEFDIAADQVQRSSPTRSNLYWQKTAAADRGEPLGVFGTPEAGLGDIDKELGMLGIRNPEIVGRRISQEIESELAAWTRTKSGTYRVSGDQARRMLRLYSRALELNPPAGQVPWAGVAGEELGWEPARVAGIGRHGPEREIHVAKEAVDPQGGPPSKKLVSAEELERSGMLSEKAKEASEFSDIAWQREVSRPAGPILPDMDPLLKEALDRSLLRSMAEAYGNHPVGKLVGKALIGKLNPKTVLNIQQFAGEMGYGHLPTHRQLERLIHDGALNPQAAKDIFTIKNELNYIKWLRGEDVPTAAYMGIPAPEVEATAIVNRYRMPDDINWFESVFGIPHKQLSKHPTARMMNNAIYEYKYQFDNYVSEGYSFIQSTKELVPNIKDRGFVRELVIDHPEGWHGEAAAKAEKYFTSKEAVENARQLFMGYKDWLEKKRYDTIWAMLKRGQQARPLKTVKDPTTGLEHIHPEDVRILESVSEGLSETVDPKTFRIMDRSRSTYGNFTDHEIDQFVHALQTFDTVDDFLAAFPDAPLKMTEQFSFWKNYRIDNYWPYIHEGQIAVSQVFGEGAEQVKKIVGYAQSPHDAVQLIRRMRAELPEQYAKARLEFGEMSSMYDDLLMQAIPNKKYQMIKRTIADATAMTPEEVDAMLAQTGALAPGTKAPWLAHAQKRVANLRPLFKDPDTEILIHNTRVGRAIYRHRIMSARDSLFESGVDNRLSEAMGVLPLKQHKNLRMLMDNELKAALGEYTMQDSIVDQALGMLNMLKNAPKETLARMVGAVDSEGIPMREIWKHRYHVNMFQGRKSGADIVGLQSILRLGFSPMSAVVNMSQLITNTAPVVGEKFLLKGMARTYGMWKESLSEAEIKAVQELYDAIGVEHQISKHMAGSEGVAAADWMTMRTRPTYEGAATVGQKAKVTADYARYYGMWMFNNAEQINRKVTANAAYLKAKNMGMSHEGAISYAEKMVIETQFLYHELAQPLFMKGPAARVLFQFKPFLVNQLSFEFDMLMGALGRGRGVPGLTGRSAHAAALAKHMSYYMLLGGMRGLANHPLWTLTFGGVAALYGKKSLEEMILARNRVRKERAMFGEGEQGSRWGAGLIGDHTGVLVDDLLTHGLPALFGASLGARIGVSGQELALDDILQGPHVAMMWDMQKAARTAISTPGQKGRAVLPLAAAAASTQIPAVSSLGLWGAGVLAAVTPNVQRAAGRLVGSQRLTDYTLADWLDNTPEGRQFQSSILPTGVRAMSKAIDVLMDEGPTDINGRPLHRPQYDNPIDDVAWDLFHVDVPDKFTGWHQVAAAIAGYQTVDDTEARAMASVVLAEAEDVRLRKGAYGDMLAAAIVRNDWDTYYRIASQAANAGVVFAYGDLQQRIERMTVPAYLTIAKYSPPEAREPEGAYR